MFSFKRVASWVILTMSATSKFSKSSRIPVNLEAFVYELWQLYLLLANKLLNLGEQDLSNHLLDLLLALLLQFGEFLDIEGLEIKLWFYFDLRDLLLALEVGWELLLLLLLIWVLSVLWLLELWLIEVLLLVPTETLWTLRTLLKLWLLVLVGKSILILILWLGILLLILIVGSSKSLLVLPWGTSGWVLILRIEGLLHHHIVGTLVNVWLVFHLVKYAHIAYLFDTHSVVVLISLHFLEFQSIALLLKWWKVHGLLFIEGEYLRYDEGLGYQFLSIFASLQVDASFLCVLGGVTFV